MTSIGKIHRRALIALTAAAALTPRAVLAQDGDRARILRDPVPSIRGPKRSIAVGNFDVIGPYANASAVNVGGPIAGMLSTALSESDRFVVVERAAIAPIITEMDMARSGVTAGSNAPMPGRAIPAQYLVVGSVTEYSLADKGGGLTVGGIGSSNTGLGFGRAKGAVALDVRVVDTRTTAVVTSFKVRQKIAANNFGLTGNYSGMPVAGNAFFNTPLGEATRRAVTDAVVRIAEFMGDQPWRGQVVKAEGSTVWVNAGAEAGVSAGDRMSIERVGEALTDPASGQVLSEEMIQLGTVTITRVEPKIAWGTYQPGSGGSPSRGDFVVLQP